MGFFDSFTGKSQQKELDRAQRDSNRLLDAGRKTAERQINDDTDRAEGLYRGVEGTLNDQYGVGRNALTQGRDSALGYLAPYLQGGQQANALYGDALGVNGLEKQQAFGANYAASDPFRAQNQGEAANSLMKVLNARGLSGSGYGAEAVARQQLLRGSEDYGNYLSRLGGYAQSGQQAAGQSAQIAGNYGGQIADYANNYGNAIGNLAGNRANNFNTRGNALANLTYGNAQQTAGMRNQYGNASAANKSTGINNLFNLAGTATKAFTAFGS